ncbi:deoxyribodipyrimidine photo-lyase [Bacillus sp. FJAT-42376]|uniref:cryptochrome/photolyase family protein n=1 Tax=Bacillus sp. FJAT-42376 TaxID=2014076 RepID=UPI000F50D6D3|nr:deoxyribodipyrimidine photo-lyase [Bacillus sp. FJAT-42376]AZB42800.1 deoxyribodipyrimidine photo-lyase [Bacillus sp. FJAT-42376]
MGSAVVWFRRDFRFQDHQALSEALSYCKQHDSNLLFVFHLNRHFLNEADTGMRHQYFMETVLDFKARCRKLGTDLLFIEGEPVKAFQQLLDKHDDINAVFFNADEAAYGKERDEKVRKWLEDKDIQVNTYQDAYIHGPDEVLKKDGSVYKVFSPYYKSWKQKRKDGIRKLSFKELEKYARKAGAVSEEAESEMKKLAKGSENMDWEIGEKAARSQLKKFIEEELDSYPSGRNIPSKKGTSLMSRYLKTGTISPRTVYAAIAQADAKEESKEAYIRELAFRDFYQMLYAHYPETKEQEFIKDYRELEWNRDERLLKAWIDGKTGYPIVDAGMRQLKKEGWMHNRLRMITASFLTKDLLLDWRMGEKYFASALVDYDPGSNVGGWQWAASVGTDAVPYFRIFNPVTQSKRFDPDGEYIKKYVEELSEVKSPRIHEPWKMTEEEQNEASCVIGKNYPEPIVDHQEQRKKAIALFKNEQ